MLRLSHWRQAALLIVLALSYAMGPGLASGQTASETVANETPTVVSVPEPASLTAHWWSFFRSDNGVESERIDQALEQYANLKASPRIAESPVARQRLDRLISNLKALKTPLPEPDVVEPLLTKPEYGFEELMDLARAAQVAAATVTDLSADVARRERSVKNLERKMDTEMAAYLQLAQAADERLAAGLAIMVDRTGLSLARRKLDSQKKTLENARQSADNREQERVAALARLTEQPENADQFARKLATAQARFDKARTEYGDVQEALVANGTDATPLARQKEHTRTVRVVSAAVEEALAELDVARWQAAADWLALEASDDDAATQAVGERSADRAMLITAVRESREGWVDTMDEAFRSPRPDASGDLSASLTAEYDRRVAIAQEGMTSLQDLSAMLAVTSTANDAASSALSIGQPTIERWFSSTQAYFADAWTATSRFMSASLFKLGDTPVTTFGLFRVLLIVTGAFWASRLFRAGLTRISSTSDSTSQASLYTVGRLAHYVLIIIGIVIGLSSIGLDFTSLAFVAGALGVGIGFGLQSIVSNFVSGLILLFERSLKVGDFVELDSGIMGVVKEINVRSTLINTNDNIDILVPNSEFVSGKLTNWTLREANRRIHVKFGVAYGTDKELVRTAVLAKAAEVAHTLNQPGREPDVWLVNFGDSSLDFELVTWVTQASVRRPGATNAAYIWAIETALAENGIEIPFPQRDLHLRSGFDKISDAEPA